MCKYCKNRYVNENDEFIETSNEVTKITTFRDGRNLFELQLHRYAVEYKGEYATKNEDIRRCELIIEESVELNGEIHYIKEKHINIKYCPFCGEKL